MKIDIDTFDLYLGGILLFLILLAGGMILILMYS